MYSYQEALEASTQYFDGDELAARVFVDKYALRDNDDNLVEKTPDDMHWRMAKEFARIEKGKFKKPLNEDQIYELFKNFKRIVPQGSPMFAIGNEYQYVSLGNCFVIPSPHDSYLGIMNTDTQITQISCRRGGVGWDISELRPERTPVRNAAKSTTGTIAFAKRFSNTIREIGQNGRRAASLQSLHVAHPDIDQFITVKQDLTQMTGSNISVKFTDNFLTSVEKNDDFELKWPIHSDTPKISRVVKAKDIFDSFVNSAWSMAEPGAMFWDTIIRRSTTAPYKKYGFIEISSNPCQPFDAKILTTDGIRNFGELKVGDIIWSEEGWTSVVRKISTGKKQTFKYKTTSGYFYGTENHKVLQNKEKIEAKDANSLDIISGPDIYNTKLIPEIIMDGLVIGDGSYKDEYSILYIGEDDQEYFNSEVKYLIGNQFDGEAFRVNTRITKDELPYTYYRSIPARYIHGSKDIVCSLLRGLYSANGSVCDNRITLKSSSKKLIEDVQLMLNSIGIKSYFTTNKSKKAKFDNGEYQCKVSYDLNITRDREKFVNLIGFIQEYKNKKIRITVSHKPIKNTFDIIEIEDCGVQEVFDITVDNNSHTYWTNGINVSNCGEQYLPPYASCRLILINLYTYVKDKFTKNAYFDFEAFAKDVRLMQRLGDDMVDLELECIDRIINKIKADPEPDEIKEPGILLWERVKECAINDRRTGCGFTALGDCIAGLNLKFDSDEALEFVDKIAETLKIESFSESVEMAKELGPFPLYDSTLDIASEFIQEIRDEHPDLYKKMTKYGRRNMTLLTVAPAGSVSCETQTSSGLESVFMLEFLRRKKGNPGDKDFRTDFIDDTGDHWMEFVVRHKGLQDWMDITGETDVKKSPYWGSTAHDIDWIKKVKMQSIIQRHIDNSISVTVNLPANVTKEKVAEIYLTAWKLGCKGMTIYRDGSRSGVLLSNDKKEEASGWIKTQAPARPKSLPCDVHHLTVKGIRYFAIVGMLDGEPYEVFISRNCNSDGDALVSRNVVDGVLEKKRRGHYNLMSGDEEVYQIVSANCDENEEVLARMTSTALRHGSDISFIVHQLEKTRGDMQSFSKVIARTLKKYIPDGTEVKGEICQNCRGKLVRSSGCIECPSCGWSKC